MYIVSELWRIPCYRLCACAYSKIIWSVRVRTCELCCFCNLDTVEWSHCRHVSVIVKPKNADDLIVTAALDGSVVVWQNDSTAWNKFMKIQFPGPVNAMKAILNPDTSSRYNLYIPLLTAGDLYILRMRTERVPRGVQFDYEHKDDHFFAQKYTL